MCLRTIQYNTQVREVRSRHERSNARYVRFAQSYIICCSTFDVIKVNALTVDCALCVLWLMYLEILWFEKEIEI